MRFLFGIFIGAALTLLIATTTDAPTNPVLNRVADLWDQLIDSTSQQLFGQRSVAALTTGAADTERNVSDLMETAATPLTPITTPQRATDFDATLAEALPEQTAALLQPTDQAESPVETSTAAAPEPPEPPAAISTQQASEATLAATNLPADVPTNALANAPGDTTLEPALADNQIATVWVPFHSERSANGFADTLSRHFEYPFSVRRNGPGAYQVTFSYADLAQRENLLLDIAELTGQ